MGIWSGVIENKIMSHRYRWVQTYGVWLADMACVFCSYLLATYLRYSGRRDYGDVRLHYAVGLIFLLFCTIYSFSNDWNRDFIERSASREIFNVVRFNIFMLILMTTLVYFLKWSYALSRIVMLAFTISNMVLMTAVHLLMKSAIRRRLSSDITVSKVVVIAEPKRLRSILRRLSANMGVGYQIVMVVSARPDKKAALEERPVRGFPCLSGLKNLSEALTDVPFDEVYISTAGISEDELSEAVSGFEQMGVTIRFSLELPFISAMNRQVGEFGGYTVVSFSRYAHSPAALHVKRVMDILGGFVGLLITAVLTLFIAPAIRLDSPGPIFFSQIRVGKNGRRFRIYKFRSMYVDAEERLEKLKDQNKMDGLMFKMDNDPRITRVGAFLRKTSLDEFPQFLNVFRGDMSLVGTRPPTIDEFEQYNEHYRRRLSMTPGLTGLWQVSGRSDITSFDDVVRLDLEYIDNWRLSLDIRIIMQTIVVVFTGRGAK